MVTIRTLITDMQIVRGKGHTIRSQDIEEVNGVNLVRTFAGLSDS